MADDWPQRLDELSGIIAQQAIGMFVIDSQRFAILLGFDQSVCEFTDGGAIIVHIGQLRGECASFRKILRPEICLEQSPQCVGIVIQVGDPA